MVRLTSMTEEALGAFLERVAAEYAADKVGTGHWESDGALDRARQELADFLPDGVFTRDHHLFTIVEETTDTALGTLWFFIERRVGSVHAFVNDLSIEPAYRRQGYATQAMQQAERVALDHGCTAMSLQVLTHNASAVGLYRKLGFEVSNLSMAKILS